MANGIHNGHNGNHNHNEIHLVNPAILREIERKRELLSKNPLFRLRLSRNVKRIFQLEDVKHSASIEVEGERRMPLEERNRIAKFSSKNLSDALTWGIRNYSEPLTEGMIKTLGVMIEPKSNTNSHNVHCGYRIFGVCVEGSKVNHVAPGEVHSQMRIFLIQNRYLTNPIDRAVHAHFNIVRIHPLDDGNGRLARLVQNLTLHANGFPPAGVRLNDREEYWDLVERARASYINYYLQASKEEVLKYKQLLGDLNDPMTPTNFHKETSIKLLRRTLAPEQAEFYNFLALRIRDNLQREQDLLEREKSKV